MGFLPHASPPGATRRFGSASSAAVSSSRPAGDSPSRTGECGNDASNGPATRPSAGHPGIPGSTPRKPGSRSPARRPSRSDGRRPGTGAVPLPGRTGCSRVRPRSEAESGPGAAAVAPGSAPPGFYQLVHQLGRRREQHPVATAGFHTQGPMGLARAMRRQARFRSISFRQLPDHPARAREIGLL